MRGKPAKKRDIKPDMIYNSVTVAKFTNYLMLDGKKAIAQGIVYGMLEKLAEATKMEPVAALEQVLTNLKPKVEVRSRRVGGANYQVPVPVSEERQASLAMRWLINFSRANRGGSTYEDSLFREALAAFNKEGVAYKKKEEIHRMAEANKAFSHLSW